MRWDPIEVLSAAAPRMLTVRIADRLRNFRPDLSHQLLLLIGTFG
jgi:hypothetical protein